MYKCCIHLDVFTGWFRLPAVLTADKWSVGVAAGVWQQVIASLFGLVAAILQLTLQTTSGLTMCNESAVATTDELSCDWVS